MIPVKAYGFGTTFRGWIGIGIGFAQGWKSPYHVGFKFLMDDGTQIGFEGSFGAGRYIEFPYLEKQKNYIGYQNAMQGRTIMERDLKLPQEQIEKLFFQCRVMVRDKVAYPKKYRMVWKLLHQKRGWPMRNTPEEQDCSESYARALYLVRVDLRDEDNENFDELSPSEVWANQEKVLRS